MKLRLMLVTLGLSGLGEVTAAPPATPICQANSRVMNSLFNHTPGASRVCNGQKYTAYATEIREYQSLGLRFEIWTAPIGKAATTFDQTLKTKLPQFGYRLTQTLSNGDVKYNHVRGSGVRVSRWTEGRQQYWLLFIY